MKSRSFALIACIFSLVAFDHVYGGPVENLAANAQTRRNVIALLRQNKLTESREHLNHIRSVAGRIGPSQIDVGQQWIRIAYQLRDSGERTLALQAAAEARVIATSLAINRGRDSVRASFLANVGLLCERVVLDLPAATAFYDAALLADPTSERIKQRQSLIENKLRHRASAKPRS